jgi:hypothetical protein
MAKDQITLAREHVTRGRAIVARQRSLIAQIRAQRRDPALAEDFLARFEASLRIFEEDLERLGASQ